MSISILKRREGIIISTIEAIDKFGLQNLSTKKIADIEGVSEGTIFRHFKNKTEIMLAVLEHFSQFDNAIIETCNNKHLEHLDRVKYFVCSYVEYYENYPAITSLVQAYDSLMCDSELTVKVRSIIDKRSDFILKTIKVAQESEIIKANTNCELLEDLIMGGIREACLKWRLSNYSFSIKDRTLAMLNMILDAFLEKSN